MLIAECRAPTTRASGNLPTSSGTARNSGRKAMKRSVSLFLFTLGWLYCSSEVLGQPSKDAAKGWFREAGFGMFVHYLGGGDHWNETVDSFDVESFADQVERSGARYLIFTLGQNSGYYCSPNSTYDRYCGFRAGERCSTRDLPGEIMTALKKRGVRLMLYLPSRAPQDDPRALSGLGDVNEREPAPQEFTRRWSEVIREWSTRYGSGVAGWWFDGAYNTAGWDDPEAPQNWRTWAAAARAGNPESILAFNRGAEISHAFIQQTGEQDYTAGEQNDFTATPESNPAPPALQWQVLAHLGSRWASPDGPQRSPEYLIRYVREVNRMKGVVTIDVHCSETGTIYPPQLDAMERIGKAIKQ